MRPAWPANDGSRRESGFLAEEEDSGAVVIIFSEEAEAAWVLGWVAVRREAIRHM